MLGKAIVVLALALSLAGCAPRGATNGPPRVVVEGDEFSKDVRILGVQILNNKLFDLEKEHWYLRSFVNPQARTTKHQLYAELTYTGSRNGAYFAADNHAQSHTVEVIYRGNCDVISRNEPCSRVDTVGVDLSESLLRANAGQGLEIKISARSGYAKILSITPSMIAAQFNATQQILSRTVVVGKTVQSGGTIQAGP